jgi:hypothetical protein
VALIPFFIPPSFLEGGGVVLTIFYHFMILLLYFVGGRFFLHNINSTWMNITSVAVLVAILLIKIFAFDSSVTMLLLLPFLMIAMTDFSKTSAILQVFVLISLSVAPSLLMWLGMVLKKTKNISSSSDGE